MPNSNRIRTSEPVWNALSPSRASPDQRKLWISMLRRPTVLIRRVAMMQPTTKREVIATEPKDAQSPLRLSACRTLGAKA
ncbi:hypothetical protein D3C72_1851070 [compost metagenome]